MTPILAVKIIDLLRDDTAVSALVGPRIYPDHAPNGVTQRPFIVWIDTTGKADESFDDMNGFDQSEVRFNCYSDSKLESMQVRKAVRDALTAPGALENVTVTQPQTRGFYDDKLTLTNSILEITFQHNAAET